MFHYQGPGEVVPFSPPWPLLPSLHSVPATLLAHQHVRLVHIVGSFARCFLSLYSFFPPQSFQVSAYILLPQRGPVLPAPLTHGSTQGPVPSPYFYFLPRTPRCWVCFVSAPMIDFLPGPLFLCSLSPHWPLISISSETWSRLPSALIYCNNLLIGYQ